MRRPFPHVCVLTLALTVSGHAVAAAQTPAELPLGKTISGKTADNGRAVYRVSAPSAGAIAIAVHAQDDVSLAVTDEEGQSLPNGTADLDLFGEVGNEQLTVIIPAAGIYHVEVRLLGSGSTTFDIGAGWIGMPGFARTLDPDGRPSAAKALEVGASHEDSLNADEGDDWDWFVLTPKTAGTLTVILRSVGDASPDLALELFNADAFAEPVISSDNDLQGNTTNESATIDVTAGQRVYAKVRGVGGYATGPYRIASSLIE